MTAPLRFGVFFAPFHPLGQDPTLALEYDLERVVALDRLGFDEAWFGEHHSGGYELIGCPEIFIAAAAERTKHIRLGTGVVSLPVPPPVAGGRPEGAARPPDPRPHHVRDRARRPAVRRLRHGHRPGRPAAGGWRSPSRPSWPCSAPRRERVDRRPTGSPCTRRGCTSAPTPGPIEVAVAAMISPSGPRLAGRYGTSLLSLSMQVIEGGFAAWRTAWDVVEEQAARSAGTQPDRATWRVLGHAHRRDQGPGHRRVHLRATGLLQVLRHRRVRPPGQRGRGRSRPPRDSSRATRRRAISSSAPPTTPSRYIEGLLEQSGGFGTFLMLGHDWARPGDRHSYRLIAREVIPHFKHSCRAKGSHDWAGQARRVVRPGRPGDHERDHLARRGTSSNVGQS